MTIEIGLDPVLVSFGHLHIRWYSLAILAAVAAGVWLATHELRRKGVHVTDMTSLVIWAVAGGILGARAFHIIDNFASFRDEPLRIIDVQSGGLAIYGAVVGGFLAVLIWSRWSSVPFLPTIDAIAPGLVLAQAIGRIGCIVNGDAWGRATDLPVAFVYSNPDAYIPNRLLGVATHPYPVYDMAMNVAVLGLLLWLRKKPLPDGALFATFVTVYAVGRFFISWVREERIWFWGLQEAQVISIMGLVLGVSALLWLFRGQVQRRPLGRDELPVRA